MFGKNLLIIVFMFLFCGTVRGADVLVEAESFSNKGGWSVDQQFMDLMGSPYLIAHGMGEAVDDAETTVEFGEAGTYMCMCALTTGFRHGLTARAPVSSR